MSVLYLRQNEDEKNKYMYIYIYTIVFTLIVALSNLRTEHLCQIIPIALRTL